MRKPAGPIPYVKVVHSRGHEYLYFDTGSDVNGKRVYKRLPARSDRSFGGVYAALLGHRERRHNASEKPTVRAAGKAYQGDKKFKDRAESTQNTYLIYLRLLDEYMGDAPVDDVKRADIRIMLDKMADRPGAANMLASVTRNVFSYAMKRDWIVTNPVDGIEAFESSGEQHEPWPEDLVEMALKDPAVRLPVALLYFTAQRIGDVCAMRWTHVQDGFVTVVQEKTGKNMDISIHARLATILAETPKEAMTILHGSKLRPLRRATLRMQLQRWAKDKGHHVVPHGLRKNAVNKLLEVGCSVGETSAISGQSLRMVEHYARGRNARKMGTAAILKWQGNAS